MNSEGKSVSFGANGHPDENQILLALEHELSPETAAQIEHHLGNCWSCRAKSEEMQRGILAFVEYHEKRYLPSLPNPPGDFGNFRGRMRSVVGQNSSVGLLAKIWRRFVALFRVPGQVRWVSAVAVLMTAILFWVEILNPPTVSASELLTRAIAAQNPPASQSSDAGVRSARQTVQIRSGGRIITRRFEWTIGSPIPHARWDVRSDFLDSDVPLTAATFADWRNALPEKKDTVKRLGHLLTLKTTTEQSFIREASIVVRASDFHPVEEHLRLRDNRRLDLTEIGFEITAQTKPKPQEVSPAKITPDKSIKASKAQSLPSESDLNEAELQLRYLLFTHQWDLGEDLTIGRTQGHVTLSGIASSTGREEAMRGVLSRLALVQLSIGAPSARATSAPTAKAESAPRSRATLSKPLLSQTLDEQFASREERLAFIDRCLGASDTALSHAWALRRLADQYSDAEMRLLKPESSARLLEMLGSHLEQIKRASTELDPLEALLTRADTSSAPSLPQRWQAAVPLLFVQVQKQDQSVAHLLVGMQTSGADLRTASANLQSSHRAIEALQATLSRLVSGSTLP